jgi:hypothetical protein
VSCERPAHQNEPNQPHVRYRAANYASALQRALERLSQQIVVDDEGRAERPLRRLSTRRPDDFTLALLDAWAVLVDVLTFYTERIANEGYLLTATERRSLLELARMIGYELSPGVAASTDLVFTLDDSPGAIRSTTIPARTQVQSLPREGGLPQAFETSADFTAYVDWNELRPRRVRQQTLALADGKLVLVDTEETLGSGATSLTGAQLDQLYLLSPGSLQEVARARVVEVAEVLLDGLFQTLEPGDLLLLAGRNRQDRWALQVTRVDEVTLDTERAQTRVRLGQAPSPPSFTFELDEVEPLAREPLPLTRQVVERRLLARQVDEKELTALRVFNQWRRDDLLALLAAPDTATPASDARGIYRFEQHLGFFGVSAPPWTATVENRRLTLLVSRRDDALMGVERLTGVPNVDSVRARIDDLLGIDERENWDRPSGWPIWKQHPSGNYYADAAAVDAYLEREEPSLAPASWAILEHGGKSGAERYLPVWISQVHTAAVTGFSLSGKATGVTMQRLVSGQLETLTNSARDQLAELTTRRATIHAIGRSLPLAELPLETPVERPATNDQPAAGAPHVMLERLVLDLRAGQRLVAQGELADAPGVDRREVVELKQVIHRYGYTVLRFVAPLTHRYRRDSLRFYANVVHATHGASVLEEVLGSGDGTVANQAFGLLHTPLTYLSAPTGNGTASTLEVRVDGIVWQEAPNLFQLEPNDRAYVVRLDDEGHSVILFGDGEYGARLPTGSENVRARYRHGIGPAGQVPAESLTLLANRAPGVRGVTNPLPAAGAAGPEVLDDARQNAPRHVRTLGRIVSLIDYEDFARSFAGIGKAQALVLWAHNRQLIHLTVAGVDGAEVASTSDLYQNLVRAIQRVQAPGTTVVVDSYQPVLFNVGLAVQVEPAYVKEHVVAAVRSALEAHFAFARRAFGQSVTAAEIVTVAQGVEGVRFVDLDVLALDEPVDATPDVPSAVLVAPRPRWNALSNTFSRAQLLLLNPAGLTVTAIEVLP